MNAIVTFALRQRVLIVVLLVRMLAAGAASFLSLNIEAYPDPVPPLVDIVTQSTGQSAEEIERYITLPLEIPMIPESYKPDISNLVRSGHFYFGWTEARRIVA